MADYRLGIPGLDEMILRVCGGANFMVLGPPLSGKGVILRNSIHAGLREGEGVILVSTGRSGEDCLDWLHGDGMEPGASRGPVGIVDCMSRLIGLSVPDTERIRRVSSPGNLTGISVAITGFLEEFWVTHGVRKARLVVDNVSTMLMYADLKMVFRYLHVIMGRLKSIEALGFYVVEEGTHTEVEISTLKQLADGIIEVKVENGQSFMRVLGIERPVPWIRFWVKEGQVGVYSGLGSEVQAEYLDVGKER